MNRVMRLVPVAIVAFGMFAAGASAARSASGGTIWVWVTPGSGAVDKIVITGAIGDHGTATSIDKDGKVNANGDYVRIKLSKGGFMVNAVALNKKTNNAPPTMFNKTTCSYAFGGSGPVTVYSGSGQYAGISGTLEITETFAGVGPLYKTGAKKGQCNINANPVAFWGAITGKGAVKFT